VVQVSLKETLPTAEGAQWSLSDGALYGRGEGKAQTAMDANPRAK